MVPDDLWDSMEPYAKPGLPGSLKEVMEPWIKQAGFPVIRAVRDYRHGSLSLTQVGHL